MEPSSADKPTASTGKDSRNTTKMLRQSERGRTTGDGPPPVVVSAAEVAQRAYHRFLARGGVQGMDLDDWLHAERELRIDVES